MTKIFVVHDSKVGAYMYPHFLRSKGEALRAWEGTANQPDSMISMHPADFTLFEVGEFDEQTGSFHMYEAKVNLGTALDFKKAPSSEAPLLSAVKS